MEIVLGMLFLALRNADIQFEDESFIWRFYGITKALLIAKLVEQINEYKFAYAVLNKILGYLLYILQF